MPALRERVRRLAPWLPLVLATALLARASIRAVLAKVGHPGAALDDAYIHFQYARAIAEGHPFRFQAGEPISTGATSFLWPAVLSLPYALGFRGESILWVAWLLSFAALGALAYETYAIARPLAGRPAAIGAGAMTLAFGGFAWSAASGMEVVPFAWLLAHAVRRACEWAEEPARRTTRELRMLAAVALVAPLMRPEGAIVSVLLGVTVALHPRAATLRARSEALVFVALAAAPNLLLVALTGHATSSTAQVKLLVGNPYAVMPAAVIANARILVTQILDGEVWSAEFLPRGGAPLAFAGLVAMAWRGHAARRPFRAAATLLLALAMFVPCLYVTFLWNRLRYLWPFATAWFVGLACLARAIGALAARLDARAGSAATALVAGGFAGALAVRLEWVIEDAAQSASGIQRQQVALGHWADANLPRDARIGVNDTGAIAYFGHRLTFDVVGLTTPSEGKYWVAGAGSRLEHYERLRRSSPGSLPTHFIVYPEWMAMDAVLGKVLHEAVVTDATILGGQVMRVFEARWDYLGTGEEPWSAHGAVTDTLDVADLESEASHRYELLGARDGEQVAEEGNAPDGAIVLDGGRTQRTRERFVVNVPRGASATLLGRVQSAGEAKLEARVGGASAGSVGVEAGPWTEVAFALPASVAGDKVTIEVTSTGAAMTTFHWWIASTGEK
jgi:heme exporter protein D